MPWGSWIATPGTHHYVGALHSKDMDGEVIGK
jgi:hypothetical protein